MKYRTLCFTAFLIGVNADLITIGIEESKDKCKNVTKIDQTLIDQARNGYFSDNRKLYGYYFCYGFNMKYIRNKWATLYGRAEMLVTIVDKKSLRYWLKDLLQHDGSTVEDALSSCILGETLRVEDNSSNLLELMKCLSEKGVPVDVVSANYVDHSVEDLNTLNEFCKSRIDIDQSLIDGAQNGNFVDSKSLGMYYICYTMNAGFLDLFNGKVSYSYLQKWYKLMLKQKSDKVDSALDRCYKSYVNIKDGKIEDILQIVKCFADEKLPVDVMFDQ